MANNGHDQWLKNQLKYQYINKVKSPHQVTLDEEIGSKIDRVLPLKRYHDLDTLLKTMSVQDIQKGYQNQVFTPKEVVAYYLKRLLIYTIDYGVVLALNKGALEACESLNQGKLYGIPVLVKDNIAVRGMTNTGGALALADAPCLKDAQVIENLKAQGAIVLGKANMSEWANFMSEPSSNGYSTLGGQTRHPKGAYDVGGSSSGSAVAVALNLAPLALGTETAGSLVYPASQNGIVALKPTHGRVALKGVIPIAHSLDVVGPMAKCVDDIELAFGASIDDYRPLQDPTSPKPTLGIVKNECASEYRPGDQEAMAYAKKVLMASGYTLVDLKVDTVDFSTDLFRVMLYEFYRDVPAYLATMNHNHLHTLEDIVAFNKKTPGSNLYGQHYLERAIKEPTTIMDYSRALSGLRDKAKAIFDCHANVDVFVGISNYSTPLYVAGGGPALNLPCWVRTSGEPVGLTLFARPYQDEVLIRVAKDFEKQNVCLKKAPLITEV